MNCETITELNAMKAKAHLIASLIVLFSIFSCGNSNNKIKTELYFGLSNADGAISADEWKQFKSETIDNVIDGYTLINSEGYWTSSDSTFNEKSILLIYIHDDTSDESKKIDSLVITYKRKFRQESVLRTDQKVKAIF